MGYTVHLTRAAERDLSSLDNTLQRRIGERIAELAIAPYGPGSEKLKGAKSRYRVRVGDYRIIYEVSDSILVVLVITIGHRREVYRR